MNLASPTEPASRAGEPARPDDEVLLARVEDALLSELSVGADAGRGLLSIASRHLCLAGTAKRARPRVLALFGRMAGADPRGLVDAGVAVELVHSASLLHDDVVDEGAVRRGAPTVNAWFGNAVAVLAGDHLLSRALVRLAPHPRALTTKTIEVVAEMAKAAIVEVEMRRDADASLASWREMAIGKTGALFGLCGFAGGALAGDLEKAARYDEIGRRLGLAFQLRDDVDDLLEGGAAGPNDLVAGNPSWPVLRAAERSPELRARLQGAWRQPVVQPAVARALADLVLETGAVDEALALVEEEVAAASALLSPERGTDAALQVIAWAATLTRATTGL